jgi:hypothetical protein
MGKMSPILKPLDIVEWERLQSAEMCQHSVFVDITAGEDILTGKELPKIFV